MNELRDQHGLDFDIIDKMLSLQPNKQNHS